MKCKRFMIVSDIHGDDQDPVAVEAAITFADKFDPEIRVINGDLYDFAALRLGAKDTTSEKGRDLEMDIHCGSEFMRRFFKKGAINHFNQGNHDCRLWNLARESQNGAIRNFAEYLCGDIEKLLKEYNATMNPYHSTKGIYKIGHLSVVHGYSCGLTAARNHVNAYGNVIFGHTHAITSERGQSVREHIAYNQGCLCKLDLSYAATKLGQLRWQQGWVYGVVFEDGTFSVHQSVGINGKFVVAKELEIL